MVCSRACVRVGGRAFMGGCGWVGEWVGVAGFLCPGSNFSRFRLGALPPAAVLPLALRPVLHTDACDAYPADELADPPELELAGEVVDRLATAVGGEQAATC